MWGSLWFFMDWDVLSLPPTPPVPPLPPDGGYAMSFINVTFNSLTVSAWQESEINYQITAREVQLYSGEYFAGVSTNTRSFPRTFDCYTENISEIDALTAEIGRFHTLIIEEETFNDCYISFLGSQKEIIRGSGKYTYRIGFSRAEQH